MCLRVLRDALVSQVETSGGPALLQAKGLWLEQIIDCTARPSLVTHRATKKAQKRY